MKVQHLPITQAINHLLLHNQIGPDGRRILRKGHQLTQDDLPALQDVGISKVHVAILEPDDIAENEAAWQLGELLSGAGISTTSATTGRVNLVATLDGVLKINLEALLRFNSQPGITLGTIPMNSVVHPRTVLGTVKIIPYGISKASLELVKAVVNPAQPVVMINPFAIQQAVLITTGSSGSRKKVTESFTQPLRNRLTTYNVQMKEGPYVAEDEAAIGQALQQALDDGAEMVLIAGETSIMDVDDITPRAIKSIGGQIEHHGVPVEPGNLLLLAYYDDVPIVGTPGCARSRSYNVVDMVLPRLAAGERLRSQDLIALGHGGLLK